MTNSVYIATGHGLTPKGVFDPGAVSGDVQEHALAHVVARHASHHLSEAGVIVLHEDHAPGENEDRNWVGSAQRANEQGVDLAVAIHFDWHKAPRGGFGIYYSEDTGGVIARAILAAYQRFDLPVRTSYSNQKFGFLRTTTMPALIWEADRTGDDVTDPDYLADLGLAIAQGIGRALNVDVAPQARPSPPAPPPPPEAPEDSVTATVVRPGPMRRGSKGSGVEQLQAELWRHGLGHLVKSVRAGKWDGIYGVKTENGVAQFQRDHSLTVTGTVDQETWVELLTT